MPKSPLPLPGLGRRAPPRSAESSPFRESRLSWHGGGQSAFGRGGLRSAETSPHAPGAFLESPEVSPLRRHKPPSRCHSLPALPAPKEERSELQRIRVFAGGSRHQTAGDLPIAALKKAEEYGRECTKQGIVPVSLDVAARIILKQPTSKALVGDRQVAAWCAAGLLDDQSEIRLKDADIAEEGAKAVASRPLEKVRSLDLAGNAIGSKGAAALGRARMPHLEALNLSKNGLGDAAVGLLLVGLTEAEAPQLLRLSLAENQISRAGQVLGNLIGVQLRLHLLDLHWNYLTGEHANGLFKGLETNLANGGSLARLDLSWNCLGNSGATQSMQSLARALKAECPLVHLDLSYNSLRAEDCGILGAGLRDNHTLVGLHLVGNSAGVDADGFVVSGDQQQAPELRPAARPQELLGQVSNGAAPQKVVTLEESKAIRGCFKSIDTDGSGSIEPEELQTALNALGLSTSLAEATALIAQRDVNHDNSLDEDEFQALMESLILKERQKEQDRLRKEQYGMDRDRSSLEARTSCWICESWQPVEITFAGEATVVWAYTSLDNYQRATQLTKGPDGKFSCQRMLPPDQICVVFQVDNEIRLVEGLETAELKEPLKLRLRQAEGLPTAAASAREVSQVSVLQLGGSKRRECKGDDDDHGAGRQRASAADGCNPAPAPPRRAVVIDDPSNPGGFCVKPRITETEYRAKKRKAPWDFKKSIFAPWRFEGTRAYSAAFSADWPHTKVHKFLKEKQDQDDAADGLRQHYGQSLRLYRRCCALSGDGSTTPGVSMPVCLDLLVSAGLLDDQYCRMADVDTMFIAARVREKGADKRPFAMKAGDTLLRFQFLEFLVRVAVARFVRTKEAESPSEGLASLMRRLEPQAGPVAGDLEGFLQDFHTEACDTVLRQHEKLLGSVYRLNSGRWSKPGEDRMMCCKEFEAVLTGADFFNDAFPGRDVTYAFTMGLQLYPDELYSLEFAQMTFLEFLHGLGASAYLRRETGPLAARLGSLMSALAAWHNVGGLLRSLRS